MRESHREGQGRAFRRGTPIRRDNDPGRASSSLIIGGLSCSPPHDSRFSEGPRKNIIQDASHLWVAKKSNLLRREARTHISVLHPVGWAHMALHGPWERERFKYFTFDVVSMDQEEIHSAVTRFFTSRGTFVVLSALILPLSKHQPVASNSWY